MCEKLTLYLKNKDIEYQELGGLVVDLVPILKCSAQEWQRALGSTENPPGYMKGVSFRSCLQQPGERSGWGTPVVALFWLLPCVTAEC